MNTTADRILEAFLKEHLSGETLPNLTSRILQTAKNRGLLQLTSPCGHNRLEKVRNLIGIKPPKNNIYKKCSGNYFNPMEFSRELNLHRALFINRHLGRYFCFTDVVGKVVKDILI